MPAHNRNAQSRQFVGFGALIPLLLIVHDDVRADVVEQFGGGYAASRQTEDDDLSSAVISQLHHSR